MLHITSLSVYLITYYLVKKIKDKGQESKQISIVYCVSYKEREKEVKKDTAKLKKFAVSFF
jgi:hypothetical protein